MSTIVAQGSLRVSLLLDQLLHNLSTFSSFLKAFSLLFSHEDFPCTGNPGFNSKDNRQVIFFSTRGVAGSCAAIALNSRFSKIQFTSLKGDSLWLRGIAKL